jgi:NTP pyrophosphatase (non-canonical NTP hydrolase)
MVQAPGGIGICDACIRTASAVIGNYTINDLVFEAHHIAKDKGWWPEELSAWAHFPSVVALIHSEVSEALTEHRNGRKLDEVYYNLEKPEKPEGIPIELADIVLRVADLCGKAGIDLEEALRIKNEYNATRAHRHGNKVL